MESKVVITDLNDKNVSDLKTRMVKSIAWVGTTKLWMQGISWISTLILARLLTPEDYGLYAMAYGVILFFELIQELGLGTAIIQKQSITKEQINSIFWFITTFSLILSIITYFIAPIASAYYDEPKITMIVKVLSIIFLLNSLGTVPYSLLTKKIDLKKRSWAEGISVVSSVVFSIILAYLGYGVWALVFGQLLRIALKNVLMFKFSKWWPGLSTTLDDMWRIINFSLHVAGSFFIDKLPNLTNPLIIGKLLGEYSMGLYSMASSLGQTNPIHRISTSVINQTSLPVFSKLQDDLKSLTEYYLKITKYLALIAFPVQIGTALVAYDLVYVILSEKWIQTVFLIQLFSLGGILFVLPLPSTPLLIARGQVGVTLKFSSIHSSVIIVVTFITAQFGIREVVTGWAISYSCIRLYLLHLANRELLLNFWIYFKNIFIPFISSIIMTLLILSFHQLIPDRMESLVRLVCDVGIGAISYIICIFVFDKDLFHEIKSIKLHLMSPTKV